MRRNRVFSIIAGIVVFAALGAIQARAEGLVPAGTVIAEPVPLQLQQPIVHLPDLEITGFVTSPSFLFPALGVVVRNSGVAASPSTSVVVHGSSSSLGAISSTRVVSSLAPGETRTVWVGQCFGELWVQAVVDPDHMIWESNESNNDSGWVHGKCIF